MKTIAADTGPQDCTDMVTLGSNGCGGDQRRDDNLTEAVFRRVALRPPGLARCGCGDALRCQFLHLQVRISPDEDCLVIGSSGCCGDVSNFPSRPGTAMGLGER